MFQPRGLFKNIQCPRHLDCSLQNCIFNHIDSTVRNGPPEGEVYDPFSAGDTEEPPPKRRKIQLPESESITSDQHVATQNGIISNSIRPNISSVPTVAEKNGQRLTDNKRRELPAYQSSKSTQPSKPASIERPVSPPPTRAKPVAVDKIEKLIPRPVAHAPAVLKVRISFVEVLYKQMTALNLPNGKANSSFPVVLLTDQQIIKWVLDEEEQAAAKLGNDIYRNAMSQKVLHFRKMKGDDWQKFVDEKFNSKTIEHKEETKLSTGISPDEEIQVLKYLRTNLTGLDAHGYVTKAPSADEIQKSKEAIKTSGNYEVCDRCSVRFQVFPGRDEHGRLTTKGACHYHWAKPTRSQRQKADHITGSAQSSFPCCGRSVGSEGCTSAATHVFKVVEPKRLAALLQFEPTPTHNDGKKRGPVAFDCEMAYTTYGLEVVRVTAVSWPQNKELLDILVRPYGEILDLNTRFSGVTPEQYTNALPYDTIRDRNDNGLAEGELEAKPLRKVDSPAMARQLMFDLLTPETPLIGHAIDNDLNTCRIIHPFVVDTVLLYPHPRGLPIRFGLKALTSTYLNRNIQTGGDAGHDSKEDSIATGDLVKIKVAEKWQMMRLQGWKFNEGVLIPPGR